MSFVNGSLYVDSFTQTGNPGEYSFESALFNNQADSGNGAYDITPGYVIFVPASDINTFTIIPGLSNRYVITSINVIDSVRVSGTMLWDTSGEETSVPTNGVFSIIAQTTPNLKLSVPSIDAFYQNLAPGSTLAAMLSDIINIMDKLGGSSPRNVSSLLQVITNGQTVFKLQQVPLSKENAVLTVNGLKYAYGLTNDFTIDGTTLTWTDISLVLEITDIVVISYNY